MSRGPLVVAIAIAAATTACPKKDPPVANKPDAATPLIAPFAARWPDPARSDAIAAGSAAMKKHQCTRCHVIDALETAARPLNCTSCHQFLKGLEPGKDQWNGIAKKYGKEVIERYQQKIAHLIRVPDLTGLGRRVRAEWIASYLREPHDLRPLLEETMGRNVVDEQDARAIARYFAAVADAPDPSVGDAKTGTMPPKPDAARLAQGRTLFVIKGCAGCHVFGNVPTGIDEKALRAGIAGSLLAPNLRFTRERMRLDAIVPWIVDPKKLLASTKMPPLDVSVEEGELLRDWLLYEDPALAAAPKTEPPPAPQPLARAVAWEEVKERVLGNVCVHCHMNDYEKDPGPGNLGGLGYAGVGLRMRTYEMLVSGAVDDKGARYSVLVPRKGETVAPIVQSLLRRRAEAARDMVGPFADHALSPFPSDKPGMPLGLPPMTDEEIAILVTWIAQGCKGPTAITGMAGIYDGYLVPDGPIEKNEGCELRMPPKKRPAWTVETEAKAKEGDGKPKPAEVKPATDAKPEAKPTTGEKPKAT